MATVSNTVKKRFVKEILQEEGEKFIKNQGLAMRKQLTFHTKDTIRRRKMNVTGDNSDGKLSIEMQSNIRFLDIKKKGKNVKDGKLKRRRQFKLYNRFVFGHYFMIARRLMFGLTDDVVARIKSELNQSNHG